MVKTAVYYAYLISYILCIFWPTITDKNQRETNQNKINSRIQYGIWLVRVGFGRKLKTNYLNLHKTNTEPTWNQLTYIKSTNRHLTNVEPTWNQHGTNADSIFFLIPTNSNMNFSRMLVLEVKPTRPT